MRERAELMAAADAARDRGDARSALARYQDVADRFGRYFPAIAQVGNMAKDLGQYDRAEAAYRRALALDPRSADVALQLGHLFKLQGRFEEARSWYATADRRRPGGEAARELGAIAGRSGGTPVPDRDLDPLSSGAALVHRRLVAAIERRPA